MLIQNANAKISGHLDVCINMYVCVPVKVQWSKLVTVIFHCGHKGCLKKRCLQIA